ncbi:MAG: DNA recombination protein RmuC, partial [Lysobacterales bacterium]
MSDLDPLWWVVTLLLMVLLALFAVWLRLRHGPAALTAQIETLTRDGERVERALREEARNGREEQTQANLAIARSLGETLDRLGASQELRLAAFAEGLRTHGERGDAQGQALRQGLIDDARRNREEVAGAQQRLTEALGERLKELSASSDERLREVRATLERQLTELRQDNAAKLEQMRATVDEKLHATLEARLDAS